MIVTPSTDRIKTIEKILSFDDWKRRVWKKIPTRKISLAERSRNKHFFNDIFKKLSKSGFCHTKYTAYIIVREYEIMRENKFHGF